jgi:hypothetical protein
MSEIKIANFAGLPILVGKKSYIPSKEELILLQNRLIFFLKIKKVI